MAKGGIAANDALLLTGTGATSSDSLTVTSNGAMFGAGAYIEAANGSTMDAGKTFTVRIQAFDGVTSVLNTTSLVTSDATGDAVFIGVTDMTKEITKVIFTLTDSSGNAVAGNFAIDKLYLQNTLTTPPPFQQLQAQALVVTGVPEPSVTLLLGPALIALALAIKKRASRA